MKKINIYLWMFVTLLGFMSCDETKDPVINSAALDGSLTFKLNKPVYSDWVYVLEAGNATLDMDSLTCVQPDYGFTAAVTYTTQICMDETFAEGTYKSLPTTVHGEKVGVNVKEMNKALIGFNGAPFTTPLPKLTVYLRLKAIISDATNNPIANDTIVKPLYSNTISIKIQPYIEPLAAYYELTPRLWYIVGLGDGAWNNSTAGIGASLIPLGPTAGKKYDINGDGEFSYTGYFETSRTFKIIRDPGEWAIQWGNKGSDGIDNPINKAIAGEEPANFKVPADGYYTITLNSIENKVTIEAANVSPNDYVKIGLIGAFNSWSGDVFLSPVEANNNHLWYTIYTFADDSECKLRANEDWASNWATSASKDGDPAYSFIGISTMGGKNMIQKKGTYIIILNDVDGSYFFIPKK